MHEFLSHATDEPPSKTAPAVARYQDRGRFFPLGNRQDRICGADVGRPNPSGSDTSVPEPPHDPLLVLLDRIENRSLFGVRDVNERTVDARIDDSDQQNLVVVG